MRWFGEYEKYPLLLLVSSMLHLLLHCPQSVTNALREYASCYSIVMHKGYVAASVCGGGVNADGGVGGIVFGMLDCG